eukprot:6185907-Amphidinium_carterae.1
MTCEAAEQGDERAVLASLRCGASVTHLQDRNENTSRTTIIEESKWHKAWVHDVDEFGWTPLLYAASFNSPKVHARQHVCALLLGWHAQPDVPEIDGCGWTPLQWAAHKDNMRLVCLDLELSWLREKSGGANPSGGRSATHGKTALAIAVRASVAMRASCCPESTHQQTEAAHGSTELAPCLTTHTVRANACFGADPKQLFCGPKKLQHHDDSVLDRSTVNSVDTQGLESCAVDVSVCVCVSATHSCTLRFPPRPLWPSSTIDAVGCTAAL